MTVLENAEIDKMGCFESAQQLFAHLKNQGFELKAPVDVEKIAQLLNIKVIEDLDLIANDVIGMISFDENKSPVISINPFENAYIPRKRFTLAHELGHFCLHSSISKKSFFDNNKTMSRTKSYWNKYEREANNFAADLLMPKDLILEVGQNVLNEYMNNNEVEKMPLDEFTERMAKAFEVSTIAMDYRLGNIGIKS